MLSLDFLAPAANTYERNNSSTDNRYEFGGMLNMVKKTVYGAILFSFCVFSLGYGQEGLRGRVIDKDSKSLQGAQVQLVLAKKTVTTDQNGSFFIEKPPTQVLQERQLPDLISFYNGILSFTPSGHQQQLQVAVFDTKGQKVSTVKAVTGSKTYTGRIIPDNLPAAVYFVRLRIGSSINVFKIITLRNQTYALSNQGCYFEKSTFNKSAITLAVVDTLTIRKDGFKDSKQNISSYVANMPDIKLESNASNDQGLPPVVNGKSGKTTRYWDCCKPHCGWHSNMKMCDQNGNTISDKNAVSSCEGGPAFQCMDYVPIKVNSKLSYGWAAFNNSGTQCGDCFQLDFQGALSGKQMIVQVVNIGDGGGDAFDLLIPGGGVGQFNGCSRQWNNASLGAQYGGFRTTCGANKDCISNMCNQAFGNRSDLMRGCNWYLDWFQMGDNPSIVFAKVSCPQKIKDISLIGN